MEFYPFSLREAPFTRLARSRAERQRKGQPTRTMFAPRRFRLWHVDGRNEFVAVVAEADTFEEIKKVRRRPDWRYVVTRNGTPLDARTGYPSLRLPGEDLTTLK